jgi:RNA polymerase sigma factor (sigma-70 family)
MTGQRQDAEDVAQETFLRAFKALARFRGESALSTWLYAIARRECYRIYRQRRRGSYTALEQLIGVAQAEQSLPGLAARESRRLAGQVREGCLLGLLRCLSFNQRLAFILNVLTRLPLKDTAAVLGKSVGATKLLVHRARASLKAFLCRNCSVDQPDNRCRCESLIGFSLKQGWIERGRRTPADEAAAIAERAASEIRGLTGIVSVYRALPGAWQAADAHRRLREAIAAHGLQILSHQKA